jgi:DNA-binding transcriptional ArsR family regulator
MPEVTSLVPILRALSSEHRLVILQWLLNPRAHFPEQQDGDLIEDGVCVGFITQKIELSQPTVTIHMQALAEAGLVTSKKIKNWVFYKPDRKAIQKALKALHKQIGVDQSYSK